jgi:DNA-binding PadR family transcriptional regulator
MRYKADAEAMVLGALAQGPQHGYGLVKTIQEGSSGLFKMNEGQLYPLLHRMQKHGWIEGAWETPQAGPARKTYTLLKDGLRELEKRQEEWSRFSRAMSSVLGVGERSRTEVQSG